MTTASRTLVLSSTSLVRPVANVYRISTVASNGASAGGPLAFGRPKTLAIKEEIRFFADESETEELLRIKARELFLARGGYDVTSPKGECIGVLENVSRIFRPRSRWRSEALQPRSSAMCSR